MNHPGVFYDWLLAILLLLLLCLQGEPCEHHYTSSTGLSGTFSSPHYPDPYPRQVYCRYYFQGKPDERIKISFEAFDLEKSTNAGCLIDYVDVFTIDSDGMQHLERRMCGDIIPAPFISIHQRVHLVFKSHGYYRSKGHIGFLGSYEFIDEIWQPFPPSDPACGPLLRTGVGGEITSPGFPKPYKPNIQCTWMIKVDQEKKILMNFVTIDLGKSVHCKHTTVDIYNGFASLKGPKTEELCGQLYFFDKGIKEFKSKSFRVVVRFRSGHLNEFNSRGFRVVWTAVTLPDEVPNAVPGSCDEFHCKGGEMCIDTSGRLCNPQPRYCIDKSLRCNNVPNCGAYDRSDEDGCMWKIIIMGLGMVALVIFVIAVAIFIAVRQRKKKVIKSASQEQALTLTVQKWDRSPSSKRHVMQITHATSPQALAQAFYASYPSPSDSEKDFDPCSTFSPKGMMRNSIDSTIKENHHNESVCRP